MVTAPSFLAVALCHLAVDLLRDSSSMSTPPWLVSDVTTPVIWMLERCSLSATGPITFKMSLRTSTVMPEETQASLRVKIFARGRTESLLVPSRLVMIEICGRGVRVKVRVFFVWGCLWEVLSFCELQHVVTCPHRLPISRENYKFVDLFSGYHILYWIDWANASRKRNFITMESI